MRLTRMTEATTIVHSDSVHLTCVENISVHSDVMERLRVKLIFFQESKLFVTYAITEVIFDIVKSNHVRNLDATKELLMSFFLTLLSTLWREDSRNKLIRDC